uniref:Presequence translocated-associated motor subunit PAM17 n=1 Tax=Panagrellus redivivus TaxID=6233 RepID=A0A7E4UWZ7_PANRE
MLGLFAGAQIGFTTTMGHAGTVFRMWTMGMDDGRKDKFGQDFKEKKVVEETMEFRQVLQKRTGMSHGSGVDTIM